MTDITRHHHHAPPRGLQIGLWFLLLIVVLTVIVILLNQTIASMGAYWST